MGVVAVVGAKGAPGATTAVLALALRWPGRVLLVDADPGGGDLLPGWLGGAAGLDRGVLGFAAATRHFPPAAAAGGLAAALAHQLVWVSEAPGVLLLPGLADAGQLAAVGDAGWTRLAAALSAPPAAELGVEWTDVLIDAGRLGPDTPWPLLAAADVVLLAVRPTVRGGHHGSHAVPALAALAARAGGPDRLGLVVCGPGPYPAQEVGHALSLPVQAELPADPRTAAALVDGGWSIRGLTRTLLLRAALGAAVRLHTTLNPAPSPASAAGLAGRGLADLIPGGRR